MQTDHNGGYVCQGNWSSRKKWEPPNIYIICISSFGWKIVKNKFVLFCVEVNHSNDREAQKNEL